MKPLPVRHRPATRLLADGASWTVIGPGSVIQGELVLAGDVLIYGRIEGTVFADGEVLVAEGGSVEGGVHARRVTVEGSCRGRVEGTQEVVLRDGAVVHADIEARFLTIDDGARFFGDCELGEGRPAPRVVQFETRNPGHA